MKNNNALLSFIAFGDPQISHLSSLRERRVSAALEQIKKSDEKFDALVLLGDITEYGRESEFNTMARLLNGASEKYDSVFAVSGNHDIRLKNHKKQIQRFNRFLNNVEGGKCVGSQHYYYSYTVKGYKFIMLGADRSAFEGTSLGRNQLIWLENELKTADKNKPVFIFNHQPLKNTNGLPYTWLGRGKWRGSVGWDNEKLRAIFEKYNNIIIYITGHLHFGASDYNYEDCGAFKAVNVPTVGVINHGECDYNSQGFLFYVYDDKIVIKQRGFADGKDFNDIIIELK